MHACGPGDTLRCRHPNAARVQELSASAVAALPYELTAAQQRCVAEILRDLAQPVPMLRLLQGDVGSGKTAVAFIAALAAVASGYQVAVLVPNEVLAAQHERFIAAAAARMPPEHRPVVEVLAGKVGAKCAPQCCPAPPSDRASPCMPYSRCQPLRLLLAASCLSGAHSRGVLGHHHTMSLCCTPHRLALLCKTATKAYQPRETRAGCT